jgi:hypothetical protein
MTEVERLPPKHVIVRPTITTIPIYRPTELYNQPAVTARKASKGKSARTARPATRGVFPVGKTFFYVHIEPLLERVELGPRAITYTRRSVEKILKHGIPRAKAQAEAAE